MSNVIVKGVWRLVDNDNQPVNVGDEYLGGSTQPLSPFMRFIIRGGQPPHKPSSTGRVYGEWENGISGEYFPTVFNLKWVEPEVGEDLIGEEAYL